MEDPPPDPLPFHGRGNMFFCPCGAPSGRNKRVASSSVAGNRPITTPPAPPAVAPPRSGFGAAPRRGAKKSFSLLVPPPGRGRGLGGGSSRLDEHHMSRRVHRI